MGIKARLIRMATVLLLAGGMIALSLPASQVAQGASAKQRKMERNRKQRDMLYERIKQLSTQKESVLSSLALVDGRLDTKQSEIRSIKAQLDQAGTRYETLSGEKDQLEAELAGRKGSLAQRARAIYMQGDLSYVDLLFQSASFGDLVDRVFFIQAILEYDGQLVHKAVTLQEELKSKLNAISQQIDAIAGIRAKLEAQLAELEEIKGEKQLDIEAVEKDKVLAMRQIKELEAENNRIRDEIRSIARSASGYRGTWSGDFKQPCTGSISSGYGYRVHPIAGVRRMHTGVDISAPEGTAIKAAGGGKVIFSGWRNGYGKCVMIDHGNNRVTLYGHMSRIDVSADDEVKQGKQIGTVGSTGYSTGNHCHFEVRINGDPVDPLK